MEAVEENEVCPICGSESFENQDGHYYCLECGTQSQTLREEIEEEPTEAASLTQQLRTKKGRKRKLEDEGMEECNLSLHECWQLIYQSYIDSLIQNGFDPSLKESAKVIWFIFLKHVFKYQLENFNRIDTMELTCNKSTHNLSNNSMRKVWLKSRRRLKGKVRTADCDNNIQDNEMLTTDLSKIKETVHKNDALKTRNAFVTKKTILILVYLSLLYSDQYITVTDYMNLTYAGIVPYYSWHQLIPRNVVQKMLLHQNTRVHEGNRSIVFKEFSKRLNQYKCCLGLQILPIDQSQIGNILLKKMLLPESLCVPLKRLLHIYRENLLAVTGYGYLYIDVNVMVAILILVKLFYRLDDHYEKLQSEHCIPVETEVDRSHCIYVWEDWVAMVTNQRYYDLQASLKPMKSNLCKLDELSTYLMQCKEKYFNSYTYSAATGVRKPNDHSPVIAPIFTEYMNSRRRALTHIDSTRRPLFVLVGDKVKVVSSSEIKPRWIPMNLSIPGHGKASQCYVPTPSANKYSTVPYNEVDMSSSQLFLLKFAAEVISIPLTDLLTRLSAAEQLLCSHIGLETNIINVYKNCINFDEQNNVDK